MTTSRAWLLAPLAALLVIAGCGVPTSGPTTRVEQVPDDVGGAYQEVDPLLPTNNAEETVEAFLGASAGDWSSRDDRLKEFTEKGGTPWSELESGNRLIRIDSDGIDLKDDANVTSAHVEVTGTIVGTYRTDGQMVRYTGDEKKYSEVFDLVRDDVSEVWRITNPPEQVVMSSAAFAERYETRPIYFPAKGGTKTLVPDVRWMPTSIAKAQERYSQLLDWLLSGPSDGIAASVHSAFPSGTTRKSVTVDESTVSVDISTEAASQELGAPSTMSAQVAWSLNLQEKQELSLLVEGQERQAELVEEWSDYNHAPDDDPDARGRVYFLHEGTVVASDTTAPFSGSQFDGLQQANIDRSGQRLAGVANLGRSTMGVVVGDDEALSLVEGVSATSLSDPQWFSSKTLLVLADGKPTLVDIETGKMSSLDVKGSGNVTQLDLSPDGRRLAYVINGRPYVAAVTGVDGLSVDLAQPHRVGMGVTQVNDLAWSQETRLMVIASVADSDDWLWELSIDNAYQEPLEGARDSAAEADTLAVRCGHPKSTDEPGQPVIVDVGGSIQRVFSDTVRPVTLRYGAEMTSASGYSPFTAG
ncbi:MAG TPA: GerMN domain-containing protein [Candidatus Stackebrandtia faecavium]|nr:GerMN domain-containing protein [Candidatus Stackebrandtia faecavium]